MKTRFRKPYERYEEGRMTSAIIVYGTRPYSVGEGYDEITHILQIDLWLVVFRFEWVTKRGK